MREVAGVIYVYYLPAGKKLLAVSRTSEKGMEIVRDFVAKMNAKAREEKDINK